jgi:hypothetical protein
LSDHHQVSKKPSGGSSLQAGETPPCASGQAAVKT